MSFLLRLIAAIAFSLSCASVTLGMDVQAAINAVSSSGGVVEIPCGAHPNGGAPLTMRTGVVLRGQGQCTSIPPIAGSPTRLYAVGLEHLTVDGALAPGYYAIDWRRITSGRISQVTTINAEYGLILTGPAYYNVIEGLFDYSSNTSVEISGGANQNTFVGGKFGAPTGLRIIGANGTTLFGTALESAINNMVFKVISGDDGSTRAFNVRQEDANHSSTYWNQ